jgi:hypothetical protein
VTVDKEALKDKIITSLLSQGFTINNAIHLPNTGKDILKEIQKKSRIEQIVIHKKFLTEHLNHAKSYCISGRDINPNKIDLELREIKRHSDDEKLYRWWNFIWWSIPYQHPYGRQLRFFLWDVTHDAPFGLFNIQSPVLKMSVRDKYLEIPKKDLDVWVNRSMHAQRVGALPPYNDLLGGKMVALSLVSNEIRDKYSKKYKNTISLMKNRTLDSDLLFLTTTSAFGKSSMYDRLKIDKEPIAIPIGYTQGYGSFQISEQIYREILEYLNETGFNTARCYGNGPSKKLKILCRSFKSLGLPEFDRHGIKREFYLFPLVYNLKEIIKDGAIPHWKNHSFDELQEYWHVRWAEKRAKGSTKWKAFKKDDYFKEIESTLNHL